jgi:hypothetical protein
MPVPSAIFSVDDAEVRYARIEGGDMGFDLAESQSVGLEKDLFASGPVGGPIHDPEKFRSAVAELLEKVDEEVSEANLILPDPWLRIALVEGEDLPRRADAREEVLKWKLQRIVPFRVEELRVRGTALRSDSRQPSAERVLLGFGLESLLRQLEGAFEDRGIHLGFISSESLTLLAAVQDLLAGVELAALAYVSRRGYSLTFALRGEPILHRYKALPQVAGDEPPRQLIDRDLHLTKTYLQDHFPNVQLRRLLLIAPQELEERWLDWLQTGFDHSAHAVRPENLPLSAGGIDMPIHELAPMLGAARYEIA